MAQSSSAKSYSLLAVILILVCIVLGYMIMTGYYPGYTLAQGRVANASADNARLKKALDSSASFLSTYQNQSKNSSLLNLALPVKNSDMANFVSSLSGLATQSGITLANLQVTYSPEVGVAQNSIRTVDLNMIVSGPYLSFRDFMTRLEEHLRIIDVNKVTFSNASGGAGTPALQYQVHMRTYYQY
ncbi:MAG TPA: type 4a pilus biogenesis protein PilO [Patescibacteria group bacterium]